MCQRLDQTLLDVGVGRRHLAQPSPLDCAVQDSEGRWHARDCDERHRAACRAADGGWTLSRKAVRFREAAKRCGEAGATFAVPRTGRENELLLRARGGEPADVWLGHRRVAGRWVALR
jgi:hypothetical protein